MWRRGHRLQQLEAEIAQARAEHAELRRRLDWFETIAAAAGAATPGMESQSTAVPGTAVPSTAMPRPAAPRPAVPSATLPGTVPPGTAAPKSGQQSTLPLVPLPLNLLAAARDLRGHDVPVRLEVAGAEVIAIVGGPGDPHEWWTAIRQTADPDTDPEEAPA